MPEKRRSPIGRAAPSQGRNEHGTDSAASGFGVRKSFRIRDRRRPCPERPHFALAGAAVLLLGACAATTRQAPVDVSRYHLGAPIPGGTVSIEPLVGAPPAGPEFRTYADPVGAELTGWAMRSRPTLVHIYRQRQPDAQHPRNGARSPAGQRRAGRGQLWARRRDRRRVQLRDRRSSGTTSSSPTSPSTSSGAATIRWCGKDMRSTEALEGTPADQSAPIAARLAHALFQGFPGESGVTITVR